MRTHCQTDLSHAPFGDTIRPRRVQPSAKRVNRSRCRFGSRLEWVQEIVYSMGSRSLHRKGHFQARRNVFVSGGYKFVRTLYNLVVKVVCLKFWHKSHLWLGGGTGGTSPELGGVQCTPCPYSSDATGHFWAGRACARHPLDFQSSRPPDATKNHAIGAKCSRDAADRHHCCEHLLRWPCTSVAKNIKQRPGVCLSVCPSACLCFLTLILLGS